VSRLIDFSSVILQFEHPIFRQLHVICPLSMRLKLLHKTVILNR
jgi:hypothetical protein